VERTWTSTPASSISASLVSTEKQFGSTVLKNESPTNISTFSGALVLGFSCSHGRGLSGAENGERSGSVGGMMCVCMSILKSDEPDTLFELPIFLLGLPWPQSQPSRRIGDMTFRVWRGSGRAFEV